jgi:hypothetical protein
MANVKLLITEVESHDSQPFGPSGTEHYSFIVSEPLGGETMTAFLSETVLRKAGMSTDYLDAVVGCTLNLQDATNLEGFVTTAEDRIDDVLNGDRNFLLVSAANGRLIKSELQKEQARRDSVDIKARIAVEMQKERDFKKKQAALTSMLARKNGTAVPAPAAVVAPATPADATPATATEPVLEKNEEDIPF